MMKKKTTAISLVFACILVYITPTYAGSEFLQAFPTVFSKPVILVSAKLSGLTVSSGTEIQVPFEVTNLGSKRSFSFSAISSEGTSTTLNVNTQELEQNGKIEVIANLKFPIIQAEQPANVTLVATSTDDPAIKNSAIATFCVSGDTDQDGLPDLWEDQNGLNKNSQKDALQDKDKDTLTNKEEFLNHTNPAQSDSDGDGITDNVELATGTNPSDPTSPLPVTPLEAQLSFNLAKSHYCVGDKLEIDLVENRNKFHHLHLDLWIAIVLPDNTQLFVKNDSSNPVSDKPQRFNQKPLEQSDLTHRIMDTEVSSGMGGHYSFYAVYVVQGTNPMENFAVIRSNIAIAEISVDNRPCVKITCSVKELPPIENRPKPMELEFTGMKSRYLIGEQIQIDLVEKLETVSNPYHNVDLWVTTILPNGGQLFFVGGIFKKFTVEQKPFKEALSGLSNYSHRILDMILGEGMGGNYSFHAVYVKEGKNPMKDFTAIISNVAWIQIYLESR